jgi:hypothetical protein
VQLRPLPVRIVALLKRHFNSARDGAGNMKVNSTSYRPIDLDQAEAEILNVTITRYIAAAGVVILIYDFLLTIGDEVGVGCTW